ncbi:hypothetical protein EMN47_11975 [Prolixibacteraceae bacterium JC049]|nr:hypothetical protein [Prolixibacteraceae bacterium JC049]
MEKKKIDHLLFLLSDPDPEVTPFILKELEKLDADALPLLEDALFQFPDSSDQLQNIIRNIKNRSVFQRIEHWLNKPNDLMEILFLICQLDYPKLSFDELKKEVDRLIREIWLEMNDNLTALEKVSLINHILFQKHQFKVMGWISRTTDSYMLNFLLKKKVGSGLLITILYLYIAKELKLEIFGIGVPEYNLLAFYDKTGIYEKIDPNRSPILFFINPSHEGSVTGRQEIEFLLSEKGYRPQSNYFEPVTEQYYLKKLITELKYCYELDQNSIKADSLGRLLQLFK